MSDTAGDLESITILNTSDASKLLSISPAKLREMATDGHIKAFRIGPRWKFRRQDLIEWVDRRAFSNLSDDAFEADQPTEDTW